MNQSQMTYLLLSTLLVSSNVDREILGSGVSQHDEEPIHEVLSRVERTVFHIRVSPTEHSEFLSQGTGFLIDDNGWGITNYHVVRGGNSATAEFSNLEGAHPVELWHVNPALDLALVKIELSDAGPQGFLQVISEEPPPGTDVWAVGFPRLGYTVTRGVVSAVRSVAEMLDAEVPVETYASSSRWIQTDCTINSGNSGGPLINAAGNVIGVNTWSWIPDSNTHFALSAIHLRDFYEGRPNEAVTFEATKQAMVGAEYPKGSLPQVSPATLTNSGSLMGRVRTWDRVIRCARCSGTGSTKVRRRVGWSAEGAFRRPVYEYFDETCRGCNGDRVANLNRISVIGQKLVTGLATLNPQDRRADQATEQLRRTLSESFNLNPAHFESLLNGEAKRLLSADQLDIGAAVIFVGFLDVDFRIPKEGHRIRMVTLPDSALSVLMLDSRLVDAVEDEPVLVGGILAGHLDSTQGHVVPVIQHGFVLAPR